MYAQVDLADQEIYLLDTRQESEDEDDSDVVCAICERREPEGT